MTLLEFYYSNLFGHRLYFVFLLLHISISRRVLVFAENGKRDTGIMDLTVFCGGF